jgi:hypothetical protein
MVGSDLYVRPVSRWRAWPVIVRLLLQQTARDHATDCQVLSELTPMYNLTCSGMVRLLETESKYYMAAKASFIVPTDLQHANQ